ncbi:MAG: hypothetical protein ACRDHZ_14445, partial [Ktedonobacteraceae bacterium]
LSQVAPWYFDRLLPGVNLTAMKDLVKETSSANACRFGNLEKVNDLSLDAVRYCAILTQNIEFAAECGSRTSVSILHGEYES